MDNSTQTRVGVPQEEQVMARSGPWAAVRQMQLWFLQERANVYRSVYYFILIFRTWMNRKQQLTKGFKLSWSHDENVKLLETKAKYSIQTQFLVVETQTDVKRAPCPTSYSFLANTSFPKQWLGIPTESQEWHTVHSKLLLSLNNWGNPERLRRAGFIRPRAGAPPAPPYSWSCAPSPGDGC